MLLSGWAVIYNLLSFGGGCQAEAFTVNYINDGDGPDRPMSSRLTTMVLAVFWVTGAVSLATATS